MERFDPWNAFVKSDPYLGTLRPMRGPSRLSSLIRNSECVVAIKSSFRDGVATSADTRPELSAQRIADLLQTSAPTADPKIAGDSARISHASP